MTIELISNFSDLGITTMFHGTTRAAWAKQGQGPLYLTASFKDASVYAEEAGEAEWDEDVHSETNMPQVVVVSISVSHLRMLLSRPGVTIEPDWGWVHGYAAEMVQAGSPLSEHPKWTDSLKKVGSVCLEGFSDEHKAVAEFIDI